MRLNKQKSNTTSYICNSCGLLTDNPNKVCPECDSWDWIEI